MDIKYYDGYKLLHKKDLNGRIPEILIVDGNRSAGKTTFFNKYLIDEFDRNGVEFMLLYRYKYELSNVADRFFNCIKDIYFNDRDMHSVSKANGTYHELYIDGVKCGYAVAINSAEQVKKQSHEFIKVQTILFDEFQSESGCYCNNEVSKFQSIHKSVARGVNQPVRFVRTILLSNSVDVLNPYYTALKLTPARINTPAKFLRGVGYVFERNFNATVAQLSEESLFCQAFSNSDYNKYSTGQGYLIDRERFIDVAKDENYRYICTLRYKNNMYGVRVLNNHINISQSYDRTFKVIFTALKGDMRVGEKLISKDFKTILTKGFYEGLVSCDSSEAQQLLLDLIQIR